ncbi:MAG: class I poly(R)-hydroxyalkanoic acid synthase [Alphaproteobacteria bacterium]
MYIEKQQLRDESDIESPLGHADPLNIGDAFKSMATSMLANPAQMVEAQASLLRSYGDLWRYTSRRMLGETPEPVIKPAPDDRRFADPAWNNSGIFEFIKQSYLLTAKWLVDTAHQVEGLDDKEARKVDFYTRQFTNAIAPTNFVLTNPEVLRATVDSNGENLVRGLENLRKDMERGDGNLRIRMVDDEAFEVGRNIAMTPGKVVYQNDLMQLIQYAPQTDQVYRRPLLIMPPWINKYYILDLREKNSFIRWAVEQGLTVFVISWVNPDAGLADKSFADYMKDGPLAALDAIERATGEKEVNVIGYCLGGTLLAATLAYMTAKNDKRFTAATFFTAMIDFAEPGELGIFIDEEQLKALETRMKARGYLEGSEMATTFNMMRANDLIWSFVINNYLLGKDPFPFDLLYWNSDSTRMPAAMHSFYLRKMYVENKLVQPGGIELDGVPIDLSTVNIPKFILSTREDHIAPWKSTYAGVHAYKGPVKFCLAASGHIAGVVNPADSGKYSHWTNNRKPKSPEAWLEGAEEHPGSWWPEWAKWIARHGGGKVPAREPGDGDLKIIEDAPGSYVKLRLK